LLQTYKRPIDDFKRYTPTDFDFALVYISDLDLFYVFPVSEFISYGSEIHLVEADKRQRRPRSADFRDAWELMVGQVSISVV
jgi:hypothetical protein